MTNPAALIRSIRLALEQHTDGAAFRAEVRRLIAEHDTPSLFAEPRPERDALEQACARVEAALPLTGELEPDDPAHDIDRCPTCDRPAHPNESTDSGEHAECYAARTGKNPRSD